MTFDFILPLSDWKNQIIIPTLLTYLNDKKVKRNGFDYNNLLNIGLTIFPRSFLGISSMKRTPPRSFSSSITSSVNRC